MRLVLDTSAAANIVLGTADGVRVAGVVEQADWVIAPGLFHSELGNTLWKTVRFGSLSQDAAVDLYDDAVALVDEFVADQPLVIQAMTAASVAGPLSPDRIAHQLPVTIGAALRDGPE